MFIIFLMMMYIINFLFINFNNPLILSMLMFIQTLLLILVLGKIYYSFWFSFIIFLVFIGGLFILFIYFISLNFNNKFFMINYKMMINLILMIMITYKFMNYYLLFFINEETQLFLMKKKMINFMKFFNFPNNYINLLLMMYLLILMIIITKITNFFKGPIKNLN